MTLSDMTAWFADGLYHRQRFSTFVDVVSFGLNGGLLVQAAYFTHTSNMRRSTCAAIVQIGPNAEEDPVMKEVKYHERLSVGWTAFLLQPGRMHGLNVRHRFLVRLRDATWSQMHGLNVRHRFLVGPWAGSDRKRCLLKNSIEAFEVKKGS